MSRPAPPLTRVVGYVYALIVVLVAMSVVAVITLAIQYRALEQDEAQADDYHVASIRHAAALGSEVLRLKALMAQRGDGSPRAAEQQDSSFDVQQQLLRSVSLISTHLEELHDLRRRYPNFDSAAALQRVDRQVLALIGTTDPYQSSLALRPGAGLAPKADTALLSVEQFRRLHEAQFIELNHQLADTRHTSARDLLIVLAFLFLFGGSIALLILRSIRSILNARQAAEQEIFEERERLSVTLQSIGDAVITTEAQGHVTYLNPAAEALTRWSTEQAAGRPLREILANADPRSSDRAQDPFDRAVQEGKLTDLGQDATMITRTGLRRAIEGRAAPIRTIGGAVIGTVTVFRDVTDSRRLASELSWHASHDQLTGLSNRFSFEQLLQSALQDSAERGAHHALLYLDLDQFKIVNDTCGHEAGDLLLQRIAKLLQRHIRGSDVIARLGGDEFGALLSSCPLDQALRIANEMREEIQDLRFVWENRALSVGVSIGLVPITPHSGTRTDVQRAADAACFAAKEKGRNRVHVYRPDDLEIDLRKGEMEWVSRITQGLEEHRFVLHAQDIVALRPDLPVGRRIELLLGLRGEDGSLVSPSAFLPAAERYNLMPMIDRWVVRTALAQLVIDGAQAVESCSINLSSQSLTDESFPGFILEQIERTGMPPSKLCFEITETAAVTHLEQAREFISTLRRAGCHFSLDAFGSGLSSFGYLQSLSVDWLKIAGHFVKGMLDDPVDRAMVDAINRVGHVVGLSTVAQCVESPAMIEELRAMGVDFAQGFALSRPEPFELASTPSAGHAQDRAGRSARDARL
jgi:diguanylate cyclase (GGDEF)-like protein/PAS domain S-box-containing protein